LLHVPLARRHACLATLEISCGKLQISGTARAGVMMITGFYLLAGGFPRVLFPPLWCFPPAVSGWGSVWVGLSPRDELASTGFHDCLQRTVRQPRPTRPRLATGARPSVPHHHPIRPRRARPTSRPTSFLCRQRGTSSPATRRPRTTRRPPVYESPPGRCRWCSRVNTSRTTPPPN